MAYSPSMPMRRWLAPCVPAAALLAAALSAHGQTADPSVRADPLDPNASVPAPSYESPFSTYRRLGEDPPVSWREANDTVTRIGGWRAYAREAQQPAPASAAQPADAVPGAAPDGSRIPMAPANGSGKAP
jgi:hypothetical protein